MTGWCDVCFLSKATLHGSDGVWSCGSCNFDVCLWCADACSTPPPKLWMWVQRELEIELPPAVEASDELHKRNDRNRKREEECLRCLDGGAAFEHCEKKARQLESRRQMKQLTLGGLLASADATR